MSALVNDALTVLEALDVEAIEKAGGKAAEAVALLALVAGQDVEPAEDSDGTDGRWRIARRTAPDRVISTVDPEARHAHKTRERRQDGFKAHVVVEPDTGLITGGALTGASGPDNSDATVGADLLGRRHRDPGMRGAWPIRRTAPVEMLAALDRGRAHPGDQAVAAAPGGRGRVHHRRLHLRPGRRHGDLPSRVTRPISAKRTVTFGVACRGCPLRPAAPPPAAAAR